MIELSTAECQERIEAGETFHARVNDGAFEICIHDYAVHVCTAIHAGHRMRDELLVKCALSDAERLYEEDPYTDYLIANQPITVIARDSRFEYDLNRAPDACIHEEAWGKTVWRKPLTPAERQRSRDKHAAFYTVLNALYHKLESRYPAVLVYDVHAFNYRRPAMPETPVFNVGTDQIDLARWQPAIDAWIAELSRIRLPGLLVEALINAIFYGRGYQATFVRKHFRNTLILPSEVKKVYMDEMRGTPIPAILEPLHDQFEMAITRHAQWFARTWAPTNEPTPA